jgi:anti-anti-sigma factor
VLYTDGVTEARGGPLGDDFFSEERLAAALTQCAGLPAEAVVERVLMLATQWVGRARPRRHRRGRHHGPAPHPPQRGRRSHPREVHRLSTNNNEAATTPGLVPELKDFPRARRLLHAAHRRPSRRHQSGSTRMNLRLTVTTTTRSACLRLAGDLDYETTGHFVEAVDRLLSQHPAHLHLDLSELTFCDSAGLCGLLFVHRRTDRAGAPAPRPPARIPRPHPRRHRHLRPPRGPFRPERPERDRGPLTGAQKFPVTVR